jgi:hypothetical protein
MHIMRKGAVAGLVTAAIGGGALGATVVSAATSSAATTTTTTTPSTTNAPPGAPGTPGAQGFQGGPRSGTFHSNENATHEKTESAQREAQENAGQFPTVP